MSDKSIKPKTPSRPKSILLIEDDADSAEVLQTFLEILGHRVDVCRNGVDGVEAARKGVHDVVICDIGLPGGLSGYDVAQEIRRMTSPTPDLLIALSGHGRPEDKSKSALSGFDAHFTKPADFDELTRLIDGHGF